MDTSHAIMRDNQSNHWHSLSETYHDHEVFCRAVINNFMFVILLLKRNLARIRTYMSIELMIRLCLHL